MNKEIQPKPLRDIVYEKLCSRILTGVLVPGSPVRDTEISVELGVSRTPVREAMLRLVKEGLLDNLHHRGFVVSHMTAGLVSETYPIVWTLEGMALKSIETFPPHLLTRLQAVNQQLAEARTQSERIETDIEWHRELIAPCTNQRLKDVVSELKAVVRRYEFAYMTEPELVSYSVADHERIMKAIQSIGPAAAPALLETHWRHSMDCLLERVP